MGLGDFLTSVDDSIDDFIAGVSPGYAKYLADDRAERAQQRQLAAMDSNAPMSVEQRQAVLQVQHPSFFQSFTGAQNSDLAGVFAGLGDIPGFDELMHVLDAPRRAIDTALITAQHADARKEGTAKDWSEFFNASTWSRAWGMASFENADRVTGGQLLVGAMAPNNDFDPFDEAEAQKIQDEANGTWYGRTLTTAIDLGTSFVSIPGTGMVTRAREAAGITTIADAERVAQRFNEVGAVERTAAQKVGDTARQFVVPDGAQNVDSLVMRQLEGLRAFDGELDEFKNFNQLKARLETAPDGDVANLANVFTEINKLADPAVRERLRMNTFLAAVGSATAKRALIEEAPLLAKNFENLTTTPREAGALTEMYAMRLDGDDVPINDVVEKVWNTPADRAELAALKDVVRQKRTALADHRRLIDELRAMKPTARDAGTEHVLAKRESLHGEVRKLQDELKQARKDLRGTKRWASGAAKDATGVGATDDVVDFNQAIGDARRRVEDLEPRLAQARADRDLLDSTPLPGYQDVADWRSVMDEARAESNGLREALDAAQADKLAARDALRTKEAEIARVRPHLDRTNALINDILDVAGRDSDLALVGDAKPTMLNRLKASIREDIGAEHYVTAGEGNTIVRLRSLPGRAARMALSPQARGSIALNEIGLGARQMADSMARSKVFTPDEIASVRSDLIRTQGMDRVGVVSRVQETMVERMALEFYRTRVPGISAEEAAAHAKAVTSLTTKSWGKGNDWVAKSADEQVSDDLVMIRDAEGQVTAYDGPMLRSQMADSAPMLDPWDFERALKTHEKTLVGNVRAGLDFAVNAHDFALNIWKVGALLRPGLMVRSMLDTGPRALASMSAAETLAATINGAANMIHNRGLKGLAKVHFAGLTPAEAAAKARFLGLKPVKVKGKYEFRFAEDATQLQNYLAASSKGQTVHGALFHDMAQKYDGLKLDRASWKRNKPDSPLWHVAYKEYADMLLASPTARKLADLTAKMGDDLDPAALREQIKESAEFAAEYRKYAQPMGRTRSEFLQQLVHEVDLMFPSERVLNAARNGGLSKKLLEREFPAGARFEVPAPEMSALQAADQFKFGKDVVDRAFRTLLDKPDMWLARNPTAVQVYNRRVKAEINALQQRFGKDYEVSAKELKAIDGRARNASIGYVRNTFFDTTRNTGLHRSVARFSPFVAAWEDAMISWGRLIYDDPRRLTKLTAAYHSPYTVQSSQDINLVVNENGERIGRGAESDGVFVMVPLGAMGKGVQDYRIRLDAINSIAQGDTWWLPGVGPSVAVAATYALGSGNVVSREAALDLANTDNPLGKALLKSVFLGGEIPASDSGTLVQSTLPGWVRTAATQYLTTGKIRTRQTNFNYLVGEALANGQELRAEDYTKLWERADKSANAAATVRLVMSAGLGLTGSASVDGQFYADQLHIIYAMTPEQRGGLTPEEFFAKEYPEAADLDWSITKNKTGIVASVNAAKSESRLSPLLKSNPSDLGWMVLGKDNMVDTEFSRTAHAMQKTDGNRVYQSADDAQEESQAAVGWKQLNAWSTQISDELVASGMDPMAVETSDQYRTAHRVIREYLVSTNPAFAKATSEITNRRDYFYGQALRLSSSGPLKDRSDMVAFRDYDAARAEVMRQFDIGSFDGSAEKYQQAKEVMRQVGATLAQRDLGFQQMWDRFLEREVE